MVDHSQNTHQDVHPIVSILKWQAYLCHHYMLHTVNSIRKGKVNYALGFFACFLVVFVVALVVTIIGNTSVVFLRLAELDVGEMDMQVRAATWSGGEGLNYTAVENIHNFLYTYMHDMSCTIFGIIIVI
jgi:hypothetical protein